MLSQPGVRKSVKSVGLRGILASVTKAAIEAFSELPIEASGVTASVAALRSSLPSRNIAQQIAQSGLIQRLLLFLLLLLLLLLLRVLWTTTT